MEATVEVEGSAPRSGLAALVQALLLGQPHESIKAKTHVAAALANVAQLVEARAVLEREGLLPAAVAVLGEALRPITRAKALAQAGGEQPAVADGAEMDALLAELCTHLCMLLRNAALSPACKGAICEGTPALQLLVGLVRTADSPALLAQAAGALQNLQDRSEVRPGMPTNPIGDGERSMLKVHQLKQRLHASGEGADAPLPPALAHVDDDMEDEGPGARTKDDYRLLHAAKLGATHDVKVRARESGAIKRTHLALRSWRENSERAPRSPSARAPRPCARARSPVRFAGAQRPVHLAADHRLARAPDAWLQPPPAARVLRARADAVSVARVVAAPRVEPRAPIGVECNATRDTVRRDGLEPE